MKVVYTTKDGRISVEIEGKTQTDIVEQLSEFQEVFEDRVCKKYGKSSDNVRFVVREDSENNKYFELRCVEPGELYGVKRAFGQHKKGGTLFPKVKDADNNWLPDNGWVRFNKNTGKEE